MIQCKDGKLKYHVNGVLIGDLTYTLGKSLSVEFNPWRATATLQEFHVRGKAKGTYEPPPRMEYCNELINVRENRPLPLPFNLPDGNCSMEIWEGMSAIAHCEATVHGKRLLVPDGVFAEAYARSPIKSNVRPHRVILAANGQNGGRFTVMMHDPQSKI